MILVDTSVWIEYFRGTERSLILNELIDNNTVCVNDIILSELIVQNILENNYQIFSYDKHFALMRELFGIRMFNILTV